MDPNRVIGGRTRGRSRDPNQQRGGGGGGDRGGGRSSSRGPGGPRQPSAWGPRPQPRPPQPSPWGPTPQQSQAYQQRAPTPASTSAGGGDVYGRVSKPRVEASKEGETKSEGHVESAVGRGAFRGRKRADEPVVVTRPQTLASKQGTSGTSIRLTANYFQFVTRSDWHLLQYRVDFAPDIDVTKIRKQLFYQATRELLTVFIFDGTLMYTHMKLPQNQHEAFVNAPGGGDPIKISIRFVGEVCEGDYHILQFFNIIMRKCLQHMKLQLVGRNYYDALARIRVPQYNIELWPGYITSIRQHENNILLCCEISHKFMRKENLLGVLYECMQNTNTYREAFNQLVIGTVVLTDYNNRTYRVDDVDWNVTPQSTFPKSDGTSVSYIDYYKQRYEIKIKEMQQPMLVSKARSREIRAGMAEIVYLVPELCRLTGITEAERSNQQMMRALANHTRLNPEARQERLLSYTDRIYSTKEIVDELNKWEVQISKRLVTVNGRVLQSENILQGPQDAKMITYPVGSDVDWTKNLRANPMCAVGNFNNWCILVPTNLKRDAVNFMQTLQRCASGMKIQLPTPDIYDVPDDRPNNILQGLETVINRFNPKLIMCIVSNNKADRYAAIKKKCCVDRAVPTQVVQKRSILSKGVMSIATKIVIQMNCKVGGAPWTLNIPLSNMMVVGFDVCHDTMHKDKSFGAMVASLDKYLTRYFSTVTAHTNGEELSNDFALNIIKAIKQYQQVNGVMPDKIVIYRDGVGDGQLHYVFEHEVKRIEEQLKNYYKGKSFKMAFIIVTKRHNTRFFYENANPPPGTVVDDIVTLPHRYDFLLVSQCVNQGTVSPTSYNVIYDNLGLDPDRIQKLTYKLTHLYYNWSGTVRVPAPCQYAHKLAFLVSQSIHRNPNPQLSQTLYFL